MQEPVEFDEVFDDWKLKKAKARAPDRTLTSFSANCFWDILNYNYDFSTFCRNSLEYYKESNCRVNMTLVGIFVT